MSYIAERRQEEKERRRAEILDATEAVAAEVGWDAMTMDQVARKARLSRALLYVYFKDKQDLLFGICERALRHAHPAIRGSRGPPQARIGPAHGHRPRVCRVFTGISGVFRGRWPAASCSRRSRTAETNEGAATSRGDECRTLMVEVIKAGIADGSIRPDVGDADTSFRMRYGPSCMAFCSSRPRRRTCCCTTAVTIKDLVEHALLMATRSVEAKALTRFFCLSFDRCPVITQVRRNGAQDAVERELRRC